MAAGKIIRGLISWGMMSGLVWVMTGCASVGDKKPGDDASSNDKTGAGDHVDVSFLLSMTFEEAKRMSPASQEVPPFYKVAADEVSVLSRTETNVPKRLRAKGRVFLQIDFREKLSGLAQEALISPEEVILRGKPLLRRGRSVVEGLDDTTVFYIRGVDLQVIGKHRITTPDAGGVTPSWSRSWKEGPNPLLPALRPEDVPKEIRASPLLPPPAGMASPVAPSMEPPKRALGQPHRDIGDAPRAVGEPPRMREPDDSQ